VATDTVPTVLAFIDTGLTNDSTYCYYVKAFGHYSSPYIGAPLVDSSEIKCAVPIDTIPPCPPVVTVTNDCGQSATDSFNLINYLTWVESDSCGFTTVKYRIYYTPDTGGSYTLIDSVVGIHNTSYNHVLNSSLAGCYIVTAVDKRGNESYKINQVCIDDCPNYDLPNTFTPNGDGFNDLFTPYHPYRFITRVDIKIFTRWGTKVFETTDPEIKWDGKDQKSGKDLSDGVYLYAGYYYEQTLHGEVRKTLPHKNGGGFIHLIRGK
jgi:gliding motility-associated-like protein